MRNLDIIIPVKNEETNIYPLIQRINKSMLDAKIAYKMIFVDDHSTDKTLEVLNLLQESYPIEIYTKKGKPGKAYSILEGAKHSKSEYVVMLDADLQYPPESISEMYFKAQENGVVVANRKGFQASFLRKTVSRIFNFSFGRLLHGFKVDVQSGLKLFRKEILDYIDEKELTPWTLDLALLNTARNLGFKIAGVDITFDKRTGGHSKVNLIKTSAEIGKNALKLKLSKRKTYLIKPVTSDTMAGAGFIHNRKWLKTHTTLKPEHSALEVFHLSQILVILLGVIILEIGIILSPITTLISIIGILSFVYFIDVLFNLYVVLKSLHFPPEITSTAEELTSLKDEGLPIYTILCPLYREAHIVPHFLEAIANLDYPKNKLDVKLLLEEDDQISIDAVKAMSLPKYVSTVIVPESEPKTKPKACNYGLNFAQGEYLVVYDAEDIPEPDQLKKAYLAFKKSKPNIVCLQAKLNYFNPHQNLLTRFFTAEYSLWFDVMLTGLQSIDTVIPLGGTSNHFRTKTLIELEGWDPFNVTEDCDLGVRLFKKGYKTAIIDSITLEEANSNVKNWIRQRSRWLKGYMQTYLVHMRKPVELVRDHGWHAFVFQLIIGARISFMLINPVLWATTFAYFAYYQYTSAFIESLFPSVVFYFAVFSLIAGNFLYIYNYMIGAAKRDHWALMKYVFLVPIYWLMGSVAAVMALYQLIVKPHYWEKTIHGLHLAKQPEIEEKTSDIIISAAVSPTTRPGIGKRLTERLADSIGFRKVYFGASTLVFASLISNFCNFFINAYLGRKLTFEDYGNLNLFTSFLFISTIPLGALSATITQKIAFLYGKYSKDQARGYLDQFVNKSMFTGIGLMLIWLVSIPFLEKFFNTNSTIPFLIFSPVWLIAIIGANFSGFLKGTLSFSKIALVGVIEALIKLSMIILLTESGMSDLVYVAIPVSMTVALVLNSILSGKPSVKKMQISHAKFNLPFYISSLLIGITNIAFLGLDVVLVKHFLSPFEAGQYGLLSLPGKMVFFFGSLLAPLMLPLVARNEGADKKSSRTFVILFGLTVSLTVSAGLGLVLFGPVILPIFFGAKIYSVLDLIPVYIAGIILFTVAQPVISYFQARENHLFVVVGFAASVGQIILLSIFHENLTQIVWIMFLVSAFNFALMGFLHILRNYIWLSERAFLDLFDLVFSPLSDKGKITVSVKEGQKRILIFNWRDIKHKWAGGAESYIHEIAKKCVDAGFQVTVFSGSDGHSPRYEVIDGIQIIRRGGFYMVYFWAALYYMLRLRGKYDVVIDSENGIPFFTPLFVKKPKFLLIHHIHQEVFRNHLPLPLAVLASFLEGKLMPLVYKNQKVITVSQSSKAEIIKLAKDNFKQIEIINPGINISTPSKLTKTANPQVLYLGRLQPYKNIDVAIKAFAQILQKYPNALFAIAGSGESSVKLKKLVSQLQIGHAVHFLGRVNDSEKHKLLTESWVMVQPSMIEGWGMTVIEANACMTPVIASDVNGLRDSIVNGKTGILVAPKNINAFADALLKIISDTKLRRELSEEAFVWSLNFSWDLSKQKFLRLINEEIHPKNYPLLGQEVFAK